MRFVPLYGNHEELDKELGVLKVDRTPLAIGDKDADDFLQKILVVPDAEIWDVLEINAKEPDFSEGCRSLFKRGCMAILLTKTTRDAKRWECQTLVHRYRNIDFYKGSLAESLLWSLEWYRADREKRFVCLNIDSCLSVLEACVLDAFKKFLNIANVV